MLRRDDVDGALQRRHLGQRSDLPPGRRIGLPKPLGQVAEVGHIGDEGLGVGSERVPDPRLVEHIERRRRQALIRVFDDLHRREDQADHQSPDAETETEPPVVPGDDGRLKQQAGRQAGEGDRDVPGVLDGRSRP